MSIVVYNRADEDHSENPNNYPCYRGGSILGNPYTDKPVHKTLAIYQAKSREDAIARYDSYFDMMYSSNPEFKAIVDEIYDKYKRGEDVYLECYCHPKPCHCDVIAKKIKERALRDKIKELKKQRKIEVGKILSSSRDRRNTGEDS